MSALWGSFSFASVGPLPPAFLAHIAVKGQGDFLSGMLHPLATPSHFLILLGLSLLVAQRVPFSLRIPVLVFVPLSFLALALTLTGKVTGLHQPILIAFALLIAALVALDLPFSLRVCTPLFAVGAFAIGCDSGLEGGSLGKALVTLLGTWLALFLILADVAWYVSFLMKHKWAQIGVRVLASWIVAIALLVLAFALRK